MGRPNPANFPRRMYDLLVRAKAGEKGLRPKYDKIVADYNKAKAAGYKDWEDVDHRNLIGLSSWIRRADAGEIKQGEE